MTALLSTNLTDLLGFTVSVLCLIAYHLFLRYRILRDPHYTIQAVNRIARTAWVESIMRSGGSRDILAVQTLRNSTMAATFLASTSVLFIMGVMTLSAQGVNLEHTWHVFNSIGSKAPELWVVKMLTMLLALFLAFFNFSMSVRVYNHVGYMINVPLSLNHEALNPEHVAFHLNRAGKFYSLGMRAYYFLVPAVLWLFGPHLMVIATLVLIVALYHLDRTPKLAKSARWYNDV